MGIGASHLDRFFCVHAACHTVTALWDVLPQPQATHATNLFENYLHLQERKVSKLDLVKFGAPYPEDYTCRVWVSQCLELEPLTVTCALWQSQYGIILAPSLQVNLYWWGGMEFQSKLKTFLSWSWPLKGLSTLLQLNFSCCFAIANSGSAIQAIRM